MSIEGFFNYARERYNIFLKKDVVGSPAPWTEDKILQQYRFCNIFREDDIVTKWIRKNVREPYADHPKLLGMIVLARWFNKIETLEVIKENNLFENWNTEDAQKALGGLSPIVSGAYIIKTPDGMNKLTGICWCLEQILPDAVHLQAHIEVGETGLADVHRVLMDYPFLGAFMSYEIVTDLRHTFMLNQAPDIMTWANPGPGAARGLSRLLGYEANHFNRSSKKDYATMMVEMQKLLELSKQDKYWSNEYPAWEMREVEHTLCEFDKYERARLGEGRPKQKYRKGV